MASQKESPKSTEVKVVEYEPNSPMFYVQAVCALTRALKHPSLQETDHEQAEATAAVCAKALDSGLVPKDYQIPKTARLLELVAQKERLGQGSSMNSAERFREQVRLESQGPIPKRDEVLTDNQQALEALKDISLSVRQTAFISALAGITAQPAVTGAREDAALGIVVESILHAIELHKRYHVPTQSLESMSDQEQQDAGANVVPWPTTYAVEIAAAIREEILASDTNGHAEAAAA